MKKNAFLLFALFVLTLIGCNKDDETLTPVAIAFVNQEVNLSIAESQVKIVFSNPTTSAGSVTLNIVPTNLVYGTDFTTNPTASNGTITVPFTANATSTTFTFTKLIEALEGQVKNVKFTIASISTANVEVPVSTNFTQLNFNETAIVNNILSPVNGGNTLPNQVYIDLSSGVTTPTVRTAWDLGFYSGNDFRVSINGAINKFSVKQLATTNIDEVQAQDANVTVGNFDPAGTAYIDHPYGNLSGTAIAEVSSTDANNKVYLVNLGQDIAATPATGTNVGLTGNSRGWKKIRILKSGNNYKLQYANIDATTHNEITISKNTAYNFSFFSFTANTVVSAEPRKEKWDINLSTFTNFTQYSGQDVSYFYPDFAVTNTKAGTRAYQVLTSEFAYDTFVLANVTTANFDTDAAKDRRAIGANWRATNPLQLKTDRFYVVKDAAGNIYKLKFTAMQNASGERGNVTFEYKKL
jgi:hypothetical protein